MKPLTKKITRLLYIVSALLPFTDTNAQQTAVSDSFKVYGNCGMCKKRIESAAMTKGVVSAVWSSETKILAVKFDSTETSADEIQKKVAIVGHDAGSYRATDDAYKKLHTCCQYERAPVANNVPDAKPPGNGILTVQFRITGMTCEEGCARGIQNALYKKKGVKSSEVNFTTGIATVVYDSTKVKKEELVRIIEHFNAEGENNFYKAEEIK